MFSRPRDPAMWRFSDAAHVPQYDVKKVLSLDFFLSGAKSSAITV